MKAEEFMTAMGQIDDDLILEALSMNMEVNTTMTNPNRSKKLMRTLLAAAIMTALLCTGVYAAVMSSMGTRDVTGEHISGTWAGQTLTLEDAALELSFSIEASPCYEVEFKPGWLPAEPDNPYSPNRDGWYTYLNNWGDPNGELPYVIYAYNGAVLGNGTKYYLNGDVEIVNQSEWKGWQRTDIRVDYREKASAAQTCMLDRSYIMLFSLEDNYLIYVASSMYDFDTLEKMADGLTVEVTDRVAQPVESGGVACFDLGRG